MGPTAGPTALRRIVRLGIASSILLVPLAAGCGSSNSTSSTTTTSGAAGQSGFSGGGASGGGQSGGGQSGGGASGPTPTIVSFTGTGDGTVDCHNGNQQTFSDHWQTTDAVRVSVTGGGSNLAPSGDGSLSFNCLTAPHTYTLTAYGSGGRTATKSITLTAVNVQGQSGGSPPTS